MKLGRDSKAGAESADQRIDQQAKQRSLAAAIERVRRGLPQLSNRGMTPLENICQQFGLSQFEQDILLLCAGVELDPEMRLLCAQAQPDLKHGAPTFGLAGALWPQHCDWAAFGPSGGLRYWRLLELGPSTTLTTAPLRISERILHELMGVSQLDEGLLDLMQVVEPGQVLVPSHQAIVEQMVGLWRQGGRAGTRPIVQLCGEDALIQQEIAAAACGQLGWKLYRLASQIVPTNTQDIQTLVKLWERESRLDQVVLFVPWFFTIELEGERHRSLAHWVESSRTPLIVGSRDRRSIDQRLVVNLDVNAPTVLEQGAVWRSALGDTWGEALGEGATEAVVERLVGQFSLGAQGIRAACLPVRGDGPDLAERGDLVDKPDLVERLWDSCRVQARPQLDALAERIVPGEGWDDVVLPEAQKQVLRTIAVHVRQRALVCDRWGFTQKGERGVGISALFAGASGTGKTMAAGVLAQMLRLDLYRVDLSAVVSKYIGETEKNLRQVFDAAEAGGVILLFDEADALFGKRSDVKDSHDRYANMEVSYLLQRMEEYRGLAILTTNLKEAIDSAFLRRIRFVVRFPFPDYGQRRQIWQRIFPADTPTAELNYKKLAKLNIAGGNIRNIALNAAFLAAEAGRSVTMVDLLQAAEGEYTKLERTLTDAEVSGWVSEKALVGQ